MQSTHSIWCLDIHFSQSLYRKDVSLPTQLQRAMATEAEASRDARAKVIAAEGEMKSSLALKQASDILCTSPAALQLRYLQTLNNIASEKNSTIIFPLPMDLINSFLPKNSESAWRWLLHNVWTHFICTFWFVCLKLCYSLNKIQLCDSLFRFFSLHSRSWHLKIYILWFERKISKRPNSYLSLLLKISSEFSKSSKEIYQQISIYLLFQLKFKKKI